MENKIKIKEHVPYCPFPSKGNDGKWFCVASGKCKGCPVWKRPSNDTEIFIDGNSLHEN